MNILRHACKSLVISAILPPIVLRHKSACMYVGISICLYGCGWISIAVPLKGDSKLVEMKVGIMWCERSVAIFFTCACSSASLLKKDPFFIYTEEMIEILLLKILEAVLSYLGIAYRHGPKKSQFDISELNKTRSSEILIFLVRERNFPAIYRSPTERFETFSRDCWAF